MKWLVVIFVVLLGWLAAGESRAQSCSASIPDVNFGAAIDTLAGLAVDSQTTVTITCTGLENRAHWVCLSLGTGVDGLSGTARGMDRDGSRNPLIKYQLYTNSGRTTVWDGPRIGNDVGGDVPAISIPTGGGSKTVTRNIFGRYLAGQQTAAPGAYFSSFSTAHTELALMENGVNTCTGTVRTSAITRPTFVARATVEPDCDTAVSPLSFGARGVLGQAVNASALVSMTCTNTTPYSTALSGGNANAAPTQRKMSKGADQVTYGLYRDSARTLPWGSAAGETLAATGSGLTQSLTVYGRLPAQATPSPGTYTDQVVVTTTY